jgi:hypothetical protein
VAFLIYPTIQVGYLSLTNSDITGQGLLSGCKTTPSYKGLRLLGLFVAYPVFHSFDGCAKHSGRLFAGNSGHPAEAAAVAYSIRFFPSVRTPGKRCHDGRTLAVGLELRHHQLSCREFRFVVPGSQLGDASGRRGDHLVDGWIQHALFIAGLQNISPGRLRSSAIDGASPFQQFIYITCPLVWPVTSLVLLLQLIAQFRDL